jgi:hypothetical protein
MSCVLTQGLPLDCRDSIGGAKSIYVLEHGNISSTVTSGVITAMTKTTGKRFWKYEMPREVANGKSTIQADEKNGSLFFNHEVSLAINKLSSLVRNELLLLMKNRLDVVVEDNNGKFWLFGRENGLLVSSGELGTGTSMSDRSGADIVLSGAEKEPMIEIDATTGGTLETPGA